VAMQRIVIARVLSTSSGRNAGIGAIDSIRDDFFTVEKPGRSGVDMKEHRESLRNLQRKFERESGVERWKKIRQVRSSLKASELMHEWLLSKPQFAEIQRLPIQFLRVDASPDCSYLSIRYRVMEDIHPRMLLRLQKILNKRFADTFRFLFARNMEFKRAPLVRFLMDYETEE
jgi:hypothetical protein